MPDGMFTAVSNPRQLGMRLPSSPGAWRSDGRRRVPAGREYDRAVDFVRVIGNAGKPVVRRR